jgi:ribonuclease HI
MISVWCDGSITGGHWGKKKGPKTTAHCYSGWVAKDESGTPVHYICFDLGEKEDYSANVAEYFAVRSALWWLGTHGYQNQAIFVHSDSQLVMSQLSGTYNTYDARLIIMRDAVRWLAGKFPSVTYKWIPREENVEADVLSKGTQIWGRVPTWDEVQNYLATGKI